MYACHPERSQPIRFANRLMESKDPWQLIDRARAARIVLSATPVSEFGKKILRLRVCFAKRSKLSAQNDTTLHSLDSYRVVPTLPTLFLRPVKREDDLASYRELVGGQVCGENA